MKKTVRLESLGAHNWLAVCRLSVGDGQRGLLPINLRRTSEDAGRLYESMGFLLYGETGYRRKLDIPEGVGV